MVGKPAKIGALEGVTIGDFITLVHGTTAMVIPVSEVSNAVALLKLLSEKSAAAAEQPEHHPGSTLLETAMRSRTRKLKRGRLWTAVEAFLAAHARAQSFKSIYSAVRHAAEGADNPEHALRVLLGRRVHAGGLLKTRSGRYRLP